MDETEDSLVFIFRFNHFDKEILQALSFYSKAGIMNWNFVTMTYYMYLVIYYDL